MDDLPSLADSARADGEPSARPWRQPRERPRDQLRVLREVDHAREIQLSMLPDANPELEWLEVASLSLPATEVGGDYYDFFEIGDGRLAVVAGDVAGHGFAAGLLLAGIRSCLTLLVDDLERPEVVMSRLNHVVKETTRRRMLVSLLILVLDRDDGRATVISAGHPPVLLRRAATGDVEELLASSLPLGALIAERFARREVTFARDDAFLLYTDGLYETSNPAGEPYGIERLTRALQAAGGAADHCRESILRDVWAFKGEAPQEDDVTFVVLKAR